MRERRPCLAVAALVARADERGVSVLADAELLALLAAGPTASSPSYTKALTAAGTLLDGVRDLSAALAKPRPRPTGRSNGLA